MTVNGPLLFLSSTLFTLTLAAFCLAVTLTGGVAARAYSIAPGVVSGIRAWMTRRADVESEVPESDDWALGPEARAILRAQSPAASIEELY